MRFKGYLRFEPISVVTGVREGRENGREGEKECEREVRGQSGVKNRRGGSERGGERERLVNG